MSIHPNPSFPLSSRDQIDVIRIFTELMQEREAAGEASPVTGSHPAISRNDGDDLSLPGEVA